MTRTAKTITVDEDVWNKAKKQAEEENRPLSNFIETVLIRYFKDIEKENPGD